MSKIHTGAERLTYDLSYLVFLAGQIGCLISFFFFNDTATTEIYTLSLHDALPIFVVYDHLEELGIFHRVNGELQFAFLHLDRKSTRLNSSHSQISYAVFCLKKKNPSLLPCWSSNPSHYQFNASVYRCLLLHDRIVC